MFPITGGRLQWPKLSRDSDARKIRTSPIRPLNGLEQLSIEVFTMLFEVILAKYILATKQSIVSGLDWIGLDWIGLDWTGFDWT